jgi:hypothetical protein
MYQWFEIQDSVDYWAAFDCPKVAWPDITKLPRYSLLPGGEYLGNTAYFTPSDDASLLGIIASRPLWFVLANIGQPLGERAGTQRYRLFDQYMRVLPIPDAPTADRSAIGDLALAITAEARARYALHQRVRGRVAADLGVPGRGLNQKLTAWWGLDFPAFRGEVQKVFRQDIPLKERDDWDAYLAEVRAEHERHTGEIVRLETELNARVYRLFDLTADEIRIVAASTKYRYGEV